ncbi:MAG: 3,4-dihydroxy-2-butanone-4-phosphate synthase [Polyangiaceae bacterium]|nr:3,4-dihydroxy-2-butanone-4-phosphate synthase [Polyangiaceae bacterium]
MSGVLGVSAELRQRVHRALDEIRAGRMVILVDDEDRENEGDLTMAAELVTPDAINFMAKYGRGLVCLTLTEEQVDRLRLPLMVAPGHAGPPLGTAFTVSIEARSGVTTGISAADRAHTIRVASNAHANPDEIVSPGHVFPLRSRTGGVLVRTGQTEGSVDLARLAGLTPAGVICEVMNDDGTMARIPDLEVFAKNHGLMIVSIADLIEYRTQTERLVHCTSQGVLKLDETQSEWQAYAYESSVDRQQFLALVKGNPSKSEDPVLCRVHRGSMISDVFSSTDVEGGSSLRASLRRIEQQGCGVVLYLPTALDIGGELRGYRVDGKEDKTKGEPLREFGLGAQVLTDLGLSKITVLTDNPRKIVGIGGYGLEVVGCCSIS